MKTTRVLTHSSFLVVLVLSAFFLSHWIGRSDSSQPVQGNPVPATAAVGLPVADAMPAVEELTETAAGPGTLATAETPAAPEPPPENRGTRVLGTVEIAGVPASGLEIAIGDRTLATREDGTFDIRLRRGLYPVRFPSLGKKALLSVPEAASFETAFRLPGPASLSGTVRLADWGVETVRVLVFRQEEEGSAESLAIAETETAADGAFRIAGLPSGAARVRFLLRGRVLREECVELPRGEWDVRILDLGGRETGR